MSPGLRDHSPFRWLLPVFAMTLVLSVATGLVIRQAYSRPVAVPAPPQTVSVPRGSEPGPREVTMLPDASGHPASPDVLALLQHHFDSINARDYSAWSGTVVAHIRDDLPRPAWLDRFRTSNDGTVVVHRIDTSDNGSLLVLLTFTSVQDAHLAPPDLPEDCIHWRAVYPLVREQNNWRVDTSPPGSSLKAKC